MKFETWFNTINNILYSECGLHIQDFPDQPYTDYYDDGLTCQEVVDVMLT